jgi:hypothetical protein
MAHTFTITMPPEPKAGDIESAWRYFAAIDVLALACYRLLMRGLAEMNAGRLPRAVGARAAATAAAINAYLTDENRPPKPYTYAKKDEAMVLEAITLARVVLSPVRETIGLVSKAASEQRGKCAIDFATEIGEFEAMLSELPDHYFTP